MALTSSLRGIEARIEETIMAHPEAVGYPGAIALRNCRVPSVTACPDVLLLPVAGPHRLVIIEAKASKAPDAASKVVGQLLMYYSGALTLGTEGLDLYWEYATQFPERSRDTRRVSLPALRRGRSIGGGDADPFFEGSRLRPNEVALFVAMEAEPHDSLKPTLDVLRTQHGLHIRFLLVHQGQVEHLF